MKKIIIFICVLIVLIAGYWFISPLFIDKKVSEDLPVASSVDLDSITQPNADTNVQNATSVTDQIQEIKKGSFTGFDKVHTGSGTARIISIDGANYIRFNEDFKVNNGPDLYVGLGKNGSYIKGSELGKLL